MKSSTSDKQIFNIVLFLLLAVPTAKGQEYKPNYETQRGFACIILDHSTGTPLEKATLRIGRFGWSADQAGRVEALANIGDTLVFTHVGYQPIILEVKDSLFAQNVVAVSLSQDTVAISEVIVKPRKLTLTETVKHISAQEAKKNIVAQQSFASGTREALTAPKQWGQWSATDNQNYTLGKYTLKNEYKGMLLQPEQEFNIAAIAIRAIAAIVAKISDRPRNSVVKPLSEEELKDILLNDYYLAEE